jgi:hypothetical protein
MCMKDRLCKKGRTLLRSDVPAGDLRVDVLLLRRLRPGQDNAQVGWERASTTS